MSTLDLLAELRRLDVNLRVDGDRLRFDAPPGVMTDRLRETLKDRKDELLEWMRRAAAASAAPSVIAPAGGDGPLPVSFSQLRMWFLHQLVPDSHLYNLAGAVRLSGALDAAALDKSLLEIQRRHSVLRTTFELRGDEPVQVVGPVVQTPLPRLDLSTLADDVREDALREVAARWVREPFDLQAGPLFRARLARLHEREHVLLLAFHHIVFDGWSVGVFVRELGALYEAFCAGRPSPLPELPIQYGDFAAWQRRWVTDEAVHGQLAYWRRQLAGTLPILELPADRQRPDVRTFGGALQPFVVPVPVAEACERMARRHGTTLAMVLLAAFKALLFRHTAQADLVVGLPTAGRTRPELEPLLGFFVNSLALRTTLSGVTTFEALVDQVRDVCLEALDNQDVPFERIVEELRPERDTRHTPIYQVMFNPLSAGGTELRLPGLTVSPMEVQTATARVDLTLSVSRSADGVAGLFEYSTDLFERHTIEGFADRFVTLLEGAVQSPTARLDELPMQPLGERQAIRAMAVGLTTDVDDQHGERDTVVALVAAQVAARPNAVAASDGRSSVTYAELDARADRLAARLRSLGVGREARAGIFLDRGVDVVVGLWAVLKAGGAYVPLDPAYPDARLAFMAADARLCAVLTHTGLRARIADARVTTVCVDEVGDDLAPGSVATADVRPDDLAYVVYTSGSTGTPKGVEVTHAALANLVRWHLRAFDLSPQDRVTQVASVGFDACGWEVWPSLAAGARLIVADDETRAAPDRLWTWLEREQASIAFVPTPLAEEALRLPVPSGVKLRALLTGGDRLTFGVPAGWPMRLVNNYGPTENAVVATSGDVAQAALSATLPSIGRPIDHVQTYVLDESMTEVPVGVVGELYVGGRSLARGYVGRPSHTAEAFVPDPFSGVPGGRLYRTRDLARWRADGVLDFVGRRDGQVKVRGFRIELGEVEAALARFPGVRAAAAAVHGHGDRKRIVGYVVPEAEGTVDRSGLAAALASWLPAYMVPSAIVSLPALPLTTNGKVDRAALPAPLDVRSGVARTVPASRSALESWITDIWSRVLDVAHVGVDDNFFDLGGHSLLLARVRAELETVVGHPVQLLTLFQYPTIAALAAHLGGKVVDMPVQVPVTSGVGADAPIAVIGRAGRFPGAPDVGTLWAQVREGRELLHRFTPEELTAAGVPPSLAADARYVPVRGVLTDVEQFDAGLFALTPRDAALLDPQQRVLLECAWTALEDAGYGPQTRRDERVGIWAGTSANTYVSRIGRSVLAEAGPAQVLVASDKDFLAPRVSYKLDLGGPAVTVQTACSTSLVAVHLACQALRAGECEVALAGGVSITVPAGGYVYQPEGIASPDGHCRPFDAAAQGTVAGNGVGVVVLKPLTAALRDGDTIHAVVRGSAINNDGADKVGFTAPSVHGQAAVIRAAHAAARVAATSIGYIEAHGTGTTLGDPIEVAALRQVFGDGAGPGTCGLGSVKGSIGHLDAAAGVAGLLTAIEAVKAAEVPATAHFTRLNEALAPGPFFVSPTVASWPDRGPVRRAGVSSFGIGGTNAHVVVEQAPTSAAAPTATGPLGGWQVVPVSGQAAGAAAAAATQLADRMETHADVALADVAYTQQVGRAALAVRRVAIGTEAAAIAAALRTAPDHTVATRPPVVWVFPGQGTQMLRMGEALYQRAPVFRAELDACAAVVAPLLGSDLRAVLYPPTERDAEAAATTQLATTAWTQVALVAVELALAAQWRAWGVGPDAVVGHSVGELAAACVAGVLTRDAALTLAATRGQAMGAAPAGGMLAVLADRETVTPHLGADLWLAAVNRAKQVVVAGPESAIVRADATFTALGINTHRLAAVGAFHSGLMAGVVAPLDAVAATLTHAAPQLPWVSTVSGAVVADAEATDATYWGRQVTAPVQWAQAVQTAAAAVGGPAVWLEVGPGHTLTHLVRGTVQVAATVASLDRPAADAALARALGALWTAGVTPDWVAVHAPAAPRRIPLPTYPFQRQRYWLDAASRTDGQDVTRLFEKKAAIDSWFYRPSWRQAVPLARVTTEATPRRWVIFADAAGLATDLCGRLEAEGHQTIVVEPGDGFEAVVDDAGIARRFVIRPDDGADYDAMLEGLETSRHGVFSIVHAWGVGPQAPAALDRRGQEEAARRRGFSSVRLLARALTRVPVERVRVNVVSTGVYAVTGAEEDLVAVNATVVGPTRTMAAEVPHVSSTHIDVTWPADERARRHATDRILAELMRADDLAVVAHRGAHRWVPTFERVDAGSSDAGAARLRQRGVYLVTGGLGGVGLVLAETLARLAQARLVLVGRSGLPARDEWNAHAQANGHGPMGHRIQAVRALEALGAQVLVIAADVSSPDQMRRVLAETHAVFGPVNGVIHAAGVAGDGTMALKSADAAAAVLAPKVGGTIVLDELLAAERPDFVVLCSSLAAFLGGAGQADYCAANAFLDAYAQRRWCLGDDTVTSINWDTWRDSGMAVDTAVPGDVAWRKALAIESGIAREEGQAVFLRALATRLPQIAVCTKDLDALAAAMAVPAASRPTFDSAEPAVSYPRPALTTRFVAPERDSERRVCAAFERALGVAGIGVHDNFFELGGHSLLAVDLMAQLNRQFDANVPVAGLYEGLTPGSVARLFEEHASPGGPRDDAGAGRRRDMAKRHQGARRRESRIERRQRG